jgi:hypothetical protein
MEYAPPEHRSPSDSCICVRRIGVPAHVSRVDAPARRRRSSERFVLMSYLERTEGEHEPIAVIKEPPVETEPKILAWGKKVLNLQAGEESRWMLCWDALG